MWSVYMLLCADGTIYTGSTNDLERRVAAHRSGKGAKYTRSRGVKKILRTERFRNRSAALKREAAIKKLNRREKLALAGK